MQTHLEKARHFREQAAHVRELILLEDNEEARKVLASLAEMYDRLCQHALKRAEKAAP